MKVLVQWTQKTARDWAETDSAEWAKTPKRPVPAPGEKGGQDRAPGWIHRLNVQGVEFVGDHYAVEHLSDGCKVTVWWDDPDSYPDGEWFAREWTFLDPAPDENLGGIVNTRQSQVVYAQPGIMATFAAHFHVGVQDLDSAVENCTFRPWSEFVQPPSEAVRHGVWVSDELNEAHESKKSLRGWQEWVR